ncbi:helix-turn-helix domain-containing protein [Pseudonocardia kujensis]|uniref:helix-turn-helix domain-containing protein n=1 Tax=Pseudonocardia kujensis TaxID=1128675 RepID=UPI001E45D6D2|nr:helix-turn-helix domain-containing protein [Pseudonocardia kujensis]MCE0767169.1 helix-turn-helix domain-containing protein [Pseudonocardia kujensis]
MTEQFSYWREVICEAFTPLAAERARARSGRAPDEPGITSWVRSSMLSATNCAEVTSRTQVITHGAAEVRRTRTDHVFVNLQLRGHCVGTQGDRTCVVPPGGFALFDTTSEYRLDFVADEATQEWHVLSYRVPRAQLLPLLADPHGFAAVAHDASAPGVAHLVASTMTSIWRNVDQLDRHARDAADVAFSSVLAAAAGGSDTLRDTSRETLDAALRASIIRYLTATVAGTRVSAEQVARRFGISVRKLHHLFQNGERSFGRTVTALRVEGCARELASGAESRTLAELAGRWGFADQSHLSRAFRSHYGCSPSEYRDNTGREFRLPPIAVGGSRS